MIHLLLTKGGLLFHSCPLFLYSLLAQNNTPLCTIYLLLALYYFIYSLREKGKEKPKPTKRLSCISPCGVIYTPQNKSTNPPIESTAAVINWMLAFVAYLLLFLDGNRTK